MQNRNVKTDRRYRMKKEDLTVPALLMEAVGLILGIVYIGLQIFYGVTYHVSPYRYMGNILCLVLVYALLTILSCHPEKINRISDELCIGKVRKLSIRMVRVVKLIFVLGLLIPCVCDALRIALKEAYSLLVIGMILLPSVYYECKILKIIRDQGKHS